MPAVLKVSISKLWRPFGLIQRRLSARLRAYAIAFRVSLSRHLIRIATLLMMDHKLARTFLYLSHKIDPRQPDTPPDIRRNRYRR